MTKRRSDSFCDLFGQVVHIHVLISAFWAVKPFEAFMFSSIFFNFFLLVCLCYHILQMWPCRENLLTRKLRLLSEVCAISSTVAAISFQFTTFSWRNFKWLSLVLFFQWYGRWTHILSPLERRKLFFQYFKLASPNSHSAD